MIVDVRTRGEYDQGHIADSINIPLSELKLKIDLIRAWKKPVVTVCRTGNRSAQAKGIVQSAGLEVYNGGAWTSLNTK